MASNQDFIIKNGLTVGSTQVIAANGRWVGANTGLVGPQGPAGPPGRDGVSTGGSGGGSGSVNVRYNGAAGGSGGGGR